MTIDTQSASATYQGDGSNRDFSIPYRVDSLTHLRVYVTNRGVTPPSVLQIAAGDYEVTGDFTLGNATLTYPKSSSLTPLSSTRYLTIERVLPLVQDVSFTTANGYFLQDLEKANDATIQKVQQINERVQRAVTVPIGSGLDPDDYYATITEAVESAQAAAAQAQAAVIDMPAVPFKEVFGIGGTTPFAITQSHNGYLAVATVGAGGLVVNLPQMSSLTFPYLVALQRESGSGTMTVNAYAGDNIVGSSSKTMATNGETIMFIADNDTLAGRWTIVSHGSGSYATGSISTAMLADDSVTAEKIADGAIQSNHYADDSISTANIQDSAITATKIESTCLTLSHMSADIIALLNGIFGQGISVISSSTTLTETHKGQILNIDTSGGAVTITLPAITSVTSPYYVAIRRYAGSGTITVQRGASDTIDGSTSTTIPATVGNAKIFTADFAGATANTWTTLFCGTDANITDGSIGLTQLSATVNALLDGILGVGVQAFNNGGSPYTLDAQHRGQVINVDASAGAVSITLPQISGSTNPYTFIVKRVAGTNPITLNRSSTNTFNGTSDTSYTLSEKVGHGAMIIADFSGATAGQWTTFLLGTKISPSDITDVELASSSVTTAKIADGAVTESKYAAGSIPTTAYKDGSVGLTQLSTTANSYLDCITHDPTGLSASTTLTSSHKGQLLNITASSSVTLTLPLISGQTAPYSVTIRRHSGASTITITANASNNINGGSAGGSITIGSTVGNAVTLHADFSGSTAGSWFTIWHNA